MKNLIFSAFFTILLCACEENTGKIGGALGDPQVTALDGGIFVNSKEIKALEKMKRMPNGTKDRDCRIFKSQGSLFEYSIFGLKLNENGNFTQAKGEKTRIVELRSQAAARISPNSSFEFFDSRLKTSLNAFNEPLKATFTYNRLIIFLKNAPKVGDPEDQLGSVSFEKLELNDFEELNSSLTFYCR